ncbi:MAG: diguanylate cyclase [Acidobacteriota bacterium]
MVVGAWVKGFPGAVTLCDPEGIILEMNEISAQSFEKSGGRELIGKNILDCHPEPSLSRLKEIMKNRCVNSYTVEKNGIKKMVYQGPWYIDKVYCGIMEMWFEIPGEMPHFVRD